MRPILQIRASRADIEKYQELLKADWSKETLDDVLSLLWKLVSESVTPAAYPWQQALEFTVSKASRKDLNPSIIQSIRNLSEAFTEVSLPAMPQTFSESRTRSVAQAEKTWTYLILQALARLKGETGLFTDTQSLLFLCAIHYLLPQMKTQSLTNEHDCLLRAMYVHTLLVWRERPEHMFYLQSLIMDYVGDERRRLELLEISLRLTPIEDHSYLTKASAYWCDLLHLGERKRALQFLLQLNRTSPPTYTEEIGEMITETLHVPTGNQGR